MEAPRAASSTIAIHFSKHYCLVRFMIVHNHQL